MDSTEISDVSGTGSIPVSPATVPGFTEYELTTLAHLIGTEAKGEQPGCLPSEEGSSPSGSAIPLVPCPDCGVMHIANRTRCTGCYVIITGKVLIKRPEDFSKEELLNYIKSFVDDAEKQRLSEFPEEAKQYGGW